VCLFVCVCLYLFCFSFSFFPLCAAFDQFTGREYVPLKSLAKTGKFVCCLFICWFFCCVSLSFFFWLVFWFQFFCWFLIFIFFFFFIFEFSFCRGGCKIWSNEQCFVWICCLRFWTWFFITKSKQVNTNKENKAEIKRKLTKINNINKISINQIKQIK
jgi:hypothetical protein